MSLSKGTVEIVGRSPPIGFYYPTMVLPSENPTSHLYYLQTVPEDDTYVYKFHFVGNGSSETLGKTSFPIGGSVWTTNDNGTKYALGGLYLGTNIVEFDVQPDSIQTSYVGNISQVFNEAYVAKLILKLI